MNQDNICHNLQNHLEQIVRQRDPYFAMGGHFYVREYIRQEFAKFGTVQTHNFNVRGKCHQNLILHLETNSHTSNKPPILIGAHYDTVPGSPGADDNGTGIAVLLELAKYFSAVAAEFPLRFVAFDMEEYGLLGSQAYAALLQQEQQPLRLMISLEMLGYCDARPNTQRYPPGLKYFYPNRGNFIALIGNLKAIPDLMAFSRNFRQINAPCEWLPVGLWGYVVPDTRRSDHAPFWDRGYRAIMVTDTANLRNPNYHSSRDTLETLDLEFLSRVCLGLKQAIKGCKN